MAHLTLEQRFKIEAYRNAVNSSSEISQHIGKDKSVISREIKCSSDQKNSVYRASLADKKLKADTYLSPKNLSSGEK